MNTMRAGFGKAELTPPMGIELAGYGYYLERKALSVNDPLFARAVMLEADGRRALVISCEVLGLSRAVCDEVIAHAATMGVHADAVMIVSVHTHTGPCIKYHEGCGVVDAEYVSTVAERICRAVDMAAHDLSEVTALAYAMRESQGDYIYNRAAPDGPVDRKVRGFTLERLSKAPIAMVSAACHGVFRGRSTAVSADFAGAINRRMEENGYCSIYLNGLCGDIDPWNPTSMRLEEYADEIVRGFLAESAELPMTLYMERIPFILRLMQVTKEDIIGAAHDAIIRAGGEDTPAGHVADIWRVEMLERFEALKDTEEISVQAMVLGGVSILGLPFEGFTQIGETIRTMTGRKDTLVLGCAEELLGYLPTKDDIQRGAYAALESTFLYKRLPVVPGEAERLATEMGKALEGSIH